MKKKVKFVGVLIVIAVLFFIGFRQYVWLPGEYCNNHIKMPETKQSLEDNAKTWFFNLKDFSVGPQEKEIPELKDKAFNETNKWLACSTDMKWRASLYIFVKQLIPFI